MNRFRKLKNDDKGMTLVEVIIAITILGIVVVPVLQSLTTSMAYNAKARVRQELTLTAESIMESFKGYGIDELKARFSDGGEGISGVTASGYSYSESTVILSDGNTAIQYVFTITDMEAENGQLYNVEVTAKPNGKESVIVPEDSESTRSAVFLGNRDWDTGNENHTVLSAIENAQKDFASDDDVKAGLLAYFTAENAVTLIEGNVVELNTADNIALLFGNSDSVVNLENYLYLYKRTLTINIDKDGSDNYIVTAGLTYSYRLEGYPYYVKVEPQSVIDTYYDEGETETAEENEAEASIGESRTLEYYPLQADGSDVYLEFSVDIASLDNMDLIYKNPTSAGLDRLYVYFYPQYDLSAGNDVIEINNNAGITNLQCYVIKQRAADINDTNTKIKDGTYRAIVQISDSTSSLVVYHNFGDNIADGSSTTAPVITGAAGSYGITAKDDSEYAENLKKEEVLSYKVELVITNSAGSTVTSLESTMNESITK